MHDLRVHFENGLGTHIYRGVGKSEMHMVFSSVPLDGVVKIGALVQTSERFSGVGTRKVSKIPDFPEISPSLSALTGGKVSILWSHLWAPVGQFVRNDRFYVIFRGFRDRFP